MRHFHYYPSVDYSNNTAVNIMVRAKIRDAIIEKRALYYKYRIKNGVRPDVLSAKYYGNSMYVWALFYANNIFNPLYDWPMEEQAFNKYLEVKYGLSYPRGGLSSVHHYELYDAESKKSLIIDEETFKKGPANNSQKLRMVTIYQYEFELNEAKRDIVILENKFLQQITNELNNIF